MNYKKILGIMFCLAFAQLHAMSQANEFEEIEKSIHAVVQMLQKKPNERPEQSGPIYDLFKQAMDKINDLKYAYEGGSFDNDAIEKIKELLQQAKNIFTRSNILEWKNLFYEKIVRLTIELEDSRKTRALNKKLAKLKAALPQGKVLLHNAIIIHGTEDEPHEGAVVSILYAALLQEAAPIVMYPGLFSKLFIRERWQKLCQADAEKPLSEVFTTFDKRWRIYGAIDESEEGKKWNRYVVLVPTAYFDMLTTEFPHLPENQLLGFNMDTSTRLTLDFFRDKNLVPSNDNLVEPQSITDCFLPKDKDNQKALWNICFIGHGNIYPQVADEEEKEEEAQQAKNTQDYLQPLFGHRKYHELLDTRKYDSCIGGMRAEDFKKFLETIQKNLAMSFFTYISCLAGGYNLYLPYLGRIVNEEGAVVSGSILPNFTVVVGSATDASVSTNAGDPECLVEVDKIPPGYTNFYKFFERLSVYTKNYVKDKETIQPARLTESELRDIMEPLIDLPKKNMDFHERLENMPLVMFPHTNHFIFLSLEPELTYVLTEARIKSAELENKPIAIQDMLGKLKENAQYIVFLAVAHMPITLDMSYQEKDVLVYIASLLPGVGLHVIKEVKALNNALDFRDFFGHTGNSFPKYFYIETVQTRKIIETKAKPLFLHHVLLRVKGDDAAMFFTDENKQLFFEKNDCSACDLKTIVPGNTMEEIVGYYLNGSGFNLAQQDLELFKPLAILFDRYNQKEEKKKAVIKTAVENAEIMRMKKAIDQAQVEVVKDFIQQEFLSASAKSDGLGYVWERAAEFTKQRNEYVVDALIQMVHAFYVAGIKENEFTAPSKQKFFAAREDAGEKKQDQQQLHLPTMSQTPVRTPQFLGGVPLVKPSYYKDSNK